MGDLNLQGLAPGHENVPTHGGQHQILSQWMRQLLEAHGLGVVETPATHMGGAALDIHITARAYEHKAKVYTFPNRLSDHALSMVTTGVTVERNGGKREVIKQTTYQQVTWSKDVKKWQKVLHGSESILHHHAGVLRGLAIGLLKKPPKEKDLTSVANLTTLLVHMIILTMGHANGATEVLPDREKEGTAVGRNRVKSRMRRKDTTKQSTKRKTTRRMYKPKLT